MSIEVLNKNMLVENRELGVKKTELHAEINLLNKEESKLRHEANRLAQDLEYATKSLNELKEQEFIASGALTTINMDMKELIAEQEAKKKHFKELESDIGNKIASAKEKIEKLAKDKLSEVKKEAEDIMAGAEYDRMEAEVMVSDASSEASEVAYDIVNKAELSAEAVRQEANDYYHTRTLEAEKMYRKSVVEASDKYADVIVKAKDKVYSLTRKIDGLNSEVTRLCQRKDGAVESLTEIESLISERQGVINSLEDDIVGYEDELQSKESRKLLRLTRDIEDIKRTLSDAKLESSESINALETENDKLYAELVELKEDNIEIKRELEDKDLILDSTKDMLNKVTVSESELKEEINSLYEELIENQDSEDVSETKITDLEEDLVESERTRERLETDIEMLEMDLNDLTIEKESLNTALEMLNEEADAGIKEKLELENTIIALQEELDESITENSTSLEDLQTENEALLVTINVNQEDISSLIDREVELTETLAAREQDIEQLNAQLSDRETKVSDLQIEVDELTTALSNSEGNREELDQLIKDNKAVMEIMTAKEEDIEDLTNKLEEYERLGDKVAELENELDISALNRIALEDKLEGLEDTADTTSLESEIASKEVLIFQLTKDMSETQEELESLRAEVERDAFSDDGDSELQRLIASNADLEYEVNELIIASNEMLQKNSKLEDELNNYSEIIDEPENPIVEQESITNQNLMTLDNVRGKLTEMWTAFVIVITCTLIATKAGLVGPLKMVSLGVLVLVVVNLGYTIHKVYKSINEAENEVTK